ncbi:hypothetical protein OOT00_06205 [Desulfobotulus sp. H1]|uniref:Transcriptional regulator n=1 Tax=Desulfobotulus pelophilus TaxID=2823377 RepID=A0ABT3N7Z3_9BACT|nr:hypothetical protein [Desulfobotulus pelophilus]MCW7753581.1 hypothetical protein [Desulfobotulus pelophilus]
MKKRSSSQDRYDDTLECYARFRMNDRICREFCAVRLRCLIEQEQQLDAGFLDDFFVPEESPLRMQ